MKKGFTILELLVAMALLAVVTVLSTLILGGITSAWNIHKARLDSFGEARVALETLSSRHSQATLNTFWDYDNRGAPTRYFRNSHLHFIQGKASELLPNVAEAHTSAVFFTAPLGISQTSDYKPLTKLLSACGFYVRFGPETKRPAFLESKIPERFRFRLYQFVQPGERLGIYSSETPREWYQAELDDWSFPMANNVIGLILRAIAPEEGGTAVRYDYDSQLNADPSDPPSTLNQLPPVISATLVLIDEDSARRLEEIYGDAPPPILPEPGSFANPAEYDQDMAEWESLLQNFTPKISYRILTVDIPIRGAKWSSQ